MSSVKLIAIIALLSVSVGMDVLSSEQPFVDISDNVIRQCTPDNFLTVLQQCRDGDTLLLSNGVYKGNIEIDKSISVRAQKGHTEVIFDGGGRGTVVRITAPRVLFQGVHVRGSGKDLMGPDCGIYVATSATGTLVRSCEVRDSLFGIWFHAVHDAEVSHCRVYGAQVGHRSNRGNGIQIFDCENAKIHNNNISDGRDGIYISATEKSDIYDNYVTGSRYAVHYMYSYNNRVWGNHCEENDHGYALMTSKHLHVFKNMSLKNEGHGLMFRDAQYCTIEDNILKGNGEGMFLYSSTENTIVNNVVSHNAVGVKIWAGSYRNIVRGNRFEGNRQQIFFSGSTDIHWGEEGRGNYWSDYMGWDQDGDGIGDIPYRVNSFSARMLYRYPQSAVLLNSPAMELLSHLESQLPALRTATVIDLHPEMDANGSYVVEVNKVSNAK